jgi:hypothetical protein
LAAGTPELVFDPGLDGCSPNDLPDAGARAFRDADGLIHLVAAHYDNRQMTGPSFGALTHRCELILRSREDPDPAAYSDRSWLTAFFTEDGRTVHGLIHNEYQGNTHPSTLCPSRQYLPCWENSILTSMSIDGGNHFSLPVPPRDLIATAPTRYIGEVAKHPIGYFQPSNIVFWHGYYYVLIGTQNFGSQQRGTCLFRTGDLRVPRNWRAWDGHGFSAAFADPYRERVPDPPPACVPLPMDQGFLPLVMTLVQDTVSEIFIASVLVYGQPGTPYPESGTYYATSRDLISWSGLSLLHAAPLPWTHQCETEVAESYPSFLDHGAKDRNFATISAVPHAFVYYTRFTFEGCGAATTRTLMRRPLAVRIGDLGAGVPGNVK